MATKRRLSSPEVPSPLRRGSGVGGTPVPLAVGAVSGPLGRDLSTMWIPRELECHLPGALAHTRPRLTERPPITVFGKPCRQPRDVGLFADEPVVPYTYSGSSTHEAQPMGKDLGIILAAVNRAVPGADFNAVLVNRYGPDGRIGFHADDEACLGTGGVVATLSAGESRTMVFKDRTTKKTVAEVPLHHGTLTVMGPGFQQKYLHGIPKRKTHIGRDGKKARNESVRVSFTFRHHKTV